LSPEQLRVLDLDSNTIQTLEHKLILFSGGKGDQDVCSMEPDDDEVDKAWERIQAKRSKYKRETWEQLERVAECDVKS
jgi:hypothetical protein